MKAIAIVCALGSIASANKWRDRQERFQGGAWLHYEATVLTDVDERHDIPKHQEIVLGGARLHGFLGQNASVAYHLGVDLMFGSTLDRAGFMYDVALFPIGIAVRARQTDVFAIGAGIGGLGAVGTIDDAVTLPIEAVGEWGGTNVRYLARFRFSYVGGSAPRQRAPSLPFADELDTTFGIRVGKHYEKYGFPSGNGYFLGANFRELGGTRYLGVTLGYSIDLATQRKWVKR